MITISDVTEEIVKRSPFIEEAIAEELLNLTAYARKIKPEIESRLYARTLHERNQNIKLSAIVMALKRFGSKIRKKTDYVGVSKKTADILNSLGDITVRSNICEFIFHNSPTLPEKQRLAIKLSISEKNSFFTIVNPKRIGDYYREVL